MTGKPSYTENDGVQKCLCRSVSPHCENVLKIFLIFFFFGCSSAPSEGKEKASDFRPGCRFLVSIETLLPAASGR